MSEEYWLADSEARVLGPIGLEVITTLHARGKLLDVRAVSRDGRKFVPLREMPELQAVLLAPVTITDAQRAQQEATRQIREWLASIQNRSTHEIFKVPQPASRDAWRAAFFALVHRYVPSRLPPDTTAELRLACEDAFLALSERMVEIERQFRAPATSLPPPPSIPAVEPPPTARIAHRNGVAAVNLHCAMHCYRTGTPDWFEFVGIQSSSHGPQEPIAIRFSTPGHPITRGLADWTTDREELYNNIKIFPTAHPLAHGRQMLKQKEGPDKAMDYVVAWANDYGKARVFSTTLGHNTVTVGDARYLDLVTRGLLWSCDKLAPGGQPLPGYGPGGAR